MAARKTTTSRKRSATRSRSKPDNDWRVLNVHIDSRKGRGLRRAALMRQTFKVMLLVAGFVMVSVMVKHAFHRMLFQNDHFTLKQFEFRTDGKLSRAVVLDKANLSGTENLLELDLAKVQAAILELPTVAEAKVEKHLPSKLVIEISERQPVAWLSCPALGIRPRSSTSGQLIDANGYAIACDRLRIEYMSFPVIEISNLPAVVTGRKIESDSLTAALECLERGAETMMPLRTTIKEIAARNDYSLLVTLDTGEEAIVSNDQVAVDVRRFADAYTELNRDLEDTRAWRVNLLAQRNVPLVFLDRERDAKAAPLPAPQVDKAPIIPRPRIVDPAEIEAMESAPVPSPPAGNPTRSVDDDLGAILNRG